MLTIIRATFTIALLLTAALPTQAETSEEKTQKAAEPVAAAASSGDSTASVLEPPPSDAPSAAANADKAAPDARTPGVKAVVSATETPEVETSKSEKKSGVPRSQRRFAVLAVLGWNSLVGFGVGGSFSIIPHLAVDLALGLGGIGLKSGVRVRGNLLTSNWTPTLGVGMQLAPGSWGEPVQVAGANNAVTEVAVEASAFLQALIGLSYQGDRGFTALIATGYSFLLDKENVRFISGDPEVAKLERTLCHGGLVVELGLGYAF